MTFDTPLCGGSSGGSKSVMKRVDVGDAPYCDHYNSPPLWCQGRGGRKVAALPPFATCRPGGNGFISRDAL